MTRCGFCNSNKFPVGRLALKPPKKCDVHCGGLKAARPTGVAEHVGTARHPYGITESAVCIDGIRREQAPALQKESKHNSQGREDDPPLFDRLYSIQQYGEELKNGT